MSEEKIIANEDIQGMDNMEAAEKEAEAFDKKREVLKSSVNAKELIDAEISSEMREAYLNYAMSVIVARALP